MDECISVIIPTHNSKDLLKQAIESALAQTYKNIEIIVSDDDSSDGTEDMIENNFKDCKKIVYIRHGHVGEYGSRNIAILRSKCPFLAFLDDDDWWDEDFLERCMDYLDNNMDAIGVFTNYFNVFPDGSTKIGYKIGKIPNKIDLNWIARGSFIDPSTMLIKKDSVVKVDMFDEGMIVTEGWDLWPRVLRFGYFVYIDQPLVYKRIRPSADLPLKTWKFNCIAIDKFRSIITEEEKRKLGSVLTNTRSRVYARYAMGLLHQGDRKNAGYFFRLSFSLKPSLKMWFRYYLTYLPSNIAKLLDGSYFRVYKEKKKIKKYEK